MTGPAKRKNKNFYRNASKKAKYRRCLTENMTGFLMTCNNREKETVREAYNLFNEYADLLYGKEEFKVEASKDAEDVKDVKAEEDSEEEEDIDAAFEKEKEGLQKQKKEQRRFQMVESGANNCVFIKTTKQIDPVLIVDKLVDDISTSGTSKARYILRLVPVVGTCKAYEKNMVELAENCLKQYFPAGTKPTYAVLFKSRNNNQIRQKETIMTFAKVVHQLNEECTVEFKNPDIVVVVEVIRNICCVGVCRNFYQHKKYNLVEMAKTDEAKEPVQCKAEASENTEGVMKDEENAAVKDEIDDTENAVVKEAAEEEKISEEKSTENCDIPSEQTPTNTVQDIDPVVQINAT